MCMSESDCRTAEVCWGHFNVLIYSGSSARQLALMHIAVGPSLAVVLPSSRLKNAQ